VLGGYAVSIWLLAVVTRQMSVSVAYAVWSGLGTAAIAVVGALAFGERLDVVKLVALVLIILGVVVLNLHSSGSHASRAGEQPTRSQVAQTAARTPATQPTPAGR
jgi:small multidrug resistance pump